MEERKLTTKRDAALSRRLIILVISAIIALALISVVYFVLLSGTPDEPPVWKHNLSSTTTNYTITITSVPYLELLSSYLVATQNATLTLIINYTSLSVISTGAYLNGLNFTDQNHDDKLSAGDYFTLDRSVYSLGSKFSLFLDNDGNLVKQITFS